MTRRLQVVVVSAIAVTLFVLLVHPAIISLEVRTTPAAKKLELEQALVLALLVVILPLALPRSAPLPIATSLASPMDSDELSLTCTRRC